MTINLSDRQESLDEAIATRLQRLKPAERRVARLLVENRHAVLLGSAAQIGALAGTSDATVVRTARSLGFNSLTALRESLLNDLTKGLSPKHEVPSKRRGIPADRCTNK